ncbi:PREDICTED: NAD-dependent protein deacetylase sirtuin-3-like [Branchiostoma belcheri]|uniref:NAD-dependent protein deacetylase sirtuin-3-like n=1 Tax=Branchiostoma belcheri TaxID=7741 RepID=A0A6P4YIC2_BRABE|nr:PREDICTED: NAD-dependent protein deacetylase sirtuin-3-like [Branchiostoma belcheri]
MGLAVLMATVRKGVTNAATKAPRSKSSNSNPSRPQTRQLRSSTSSATPPGSAGKKDGGSAKGRKVGALPAKSKSETSLAASFQKLSVKETKTSVPGQQKSARAISTSSRAISTSSRKSSGSSSAGGRGGKTFAGIDDVARYILAKKCKNVVVMAGAGISTPSGIPDFRSPGTGLYDNLQQYNIPYPEAIFDIDYFHMDSRPFYTLAKELYPGNYRPNYVHYFIRLLHEKGLLLRMYTQNIDGLERMSGIPEAKLVEAHGTFATASCVRCNARYSGKHIKAAIMRGETPKCTNSKWCKGKIKPDIVFFGEDLPRRFYYYLKDFPVCDLLLVMGTSLEVEPFASIVNSTRGYVPRVLFNRDPVGPFGRVPLRDTDCAELGDLVQGIQRFTRILGWKQAMEELIQKAEKELDDKLKNDTLFNGVVESDSDSSSGSNSPANGAPPRRQYHTFTRRPLIPQGRRNGNVSSGSSSSNNRMNYRAKKEESSEESSEESDSSEGESSDGSSSN